MIARLLSDLREYAGRIASEFTRSLANQRVLSVESRVNISRVHGRIDELRFLIDHQAGLYLDDPRIQEARPLLRRSGTKDRTSRPIPDLRRTASALHRVRDDPSFPNAIVLRRG